MEEPRQSGVDRRRFVKGVTATIGGGALAGCSDLVGSNSSGSGKATTSGGSSSEKTTTSDGSASKKTTTSSGSYSVTMAPTGTVTFESVPKRWAPYDGGYADMGVALGQSDGITGGGNMDEWHTDAYDELPGVNVDTSAAMENPEVRDKETFYELQNDVHVYDPGMLKNWFDWDQSDIDEISENVGPFLGNLIFRREDKWHDYRYYTLYQAFGKMATLFQEQERYRAFKTLHDEFIASIQKQLPAADKRPTVLLTYEHTDEPEKFSPYRLNDKGTSKKQWRDLGVSDALAGTGIHGISTTDRGELDYENLLEIDPEILLVRGHEDDSATEFRDTVLGYMQEHPVGSELSAVQNGRVYRGGPLHQGPIHNLFQTERAAKQIYPEIFGDVTSDKQLFDRQQVADIVNGDFDTA